MALYPTYHRAKPMHIAVTKLAPISITAMLMALWTLWKRFIDFDWHHKN
jgi:hypothetical protein